MAGGSLGQGWIKSSRTKRMMDTIKVITRLRIGLMAWYDKKYLGGRRFPPRLAS